MDVSKSRTLRFMLEGHSASYEQMLEKSGKSSLDLRFSKPNIEIDETLNKFNPNFIKEISTTVKHQTCMRAKWNKSKYFKKEADSLRN